MATIVEEETCTPPEILELAESECQDLLPQKSKHLYNKKYQDFIKWSTEKSIIYLYCLWSQFYSVIQVGEGTTKSNNRELASYPLNDLATEGGIPASIPVSQQGEVLTPKRQAVVDRLRRRIESYRRHRNDCIPRFDHSFNGVIEQNIQDTLLLKQRFLENKAKRSVKKSDKKDNSMQNASHSIPKFPTKRSASDEVEINSDSYNEPPPNKSQQPQKQSHENLTKFSVEIVQQLEFTTTTTNSQISTNVTVKAMNTSVKSDPQPPPQAPNLQPPSPRDPDIVKCKQEPENIEFVDLEQCAAALEKDAAANGGNSFPGFSDFIGDDTSDAIITSDAFKDLISEISDLNPEFMKDFDFDSGVPKNHHEEEHQIKTEPSHGNPTHQNTTQSSLHNNACNQPQNKTNFSSGMDFSKAELSPAAQTLKQMAEQHQHKTQMGLSFNPSRQNTKSSYDFPFNNSSDFMNQQSANQANFKSGVAQSVFNPDNVKQEVFSSQNSPVTFSPGRNVPSPQNRLGSQFKPQYSSYSSAGTNGSQQYNGGRQQSQQPGPQNGQQQPPRPPSSSSNIQANQAQHIQAQGPVQVSMSQNINADIKSNKANLAAHQGIYMSANPGSYCSVSQSQTINFTQQVLRQRAPASVRPTHNMARDHHPGMDMMGPNVMNGPRVPRPDYNGHSLQHPMMRFPQHRMVPLQPMPPSGPMIRTSQNYGTSNINMQMHQSRVMSYNTPTPVRHMGQLNAPDPGSWRNMLPQQQQAQAQQQQQQQQQVQFHQVQNVAFNSSEAQMSASQMQQMNMPQHQSLGMHQANPTMSLRVQMSQHNAGAAVYTSSNSRSMPQHLSTLPMANYGQNTSSNFASQSYVADRSVHQTSQQQQSIFNQNGIPSDFNLDFLEQFPTTDSSNFTADQEFLNSLDANSSFNFQDIL